ncbi:9715_t:CDS:2 [Cetraspora pellucida]|uniref:9715_t:CDS:1 n=1 Tax=Cetraspora pellucida TaxID=1433469 RepID=A0A9N9ILH9_9GLOM|nr:9715_t:CDS:2 [Cetraspora pellucida]
MNQYQKIIKILQKNYNKLSYYKKIVTSLELTLELEEIEQHQSYQEILQILIEEESTSQEISKENHTQKAEIYKESAKEINKSIANIQ